MEGPEREYRPEPPETPCEERADTDKGHGGSVGFSGVRDPALQEFVTASSQIAHNTDIVPDEQICPKRCENSDDRCEQHRYDESAGTHT